MIKRLIDITISATVLVVFAPVMAMVAGLVRLKLGSPVLFRQSRPGLHGQPFDVIKFRTMTDAKDSHGKLLSDAERLSPLGAWLRSTSLDELPQMINVLRGDMSLVGPRPLLHEYLPLYSPRQAIRHTVRPGLTGWAQVNGRNALSWPDRLEMDAWYVENQNLGLDLKILLMTVGKVFSRSGVSQEGNATVERFHGNNDTTQSGHR